MTSSRSNKEIGEPQDWFKSAFGSLYPVIYAHRTVEAAAPEARFAAIAVSLKPTDHALDLCCGTGRHLVTLQETGALLTGLDYSSDLLARARNQLLPGVSLVRSDMRRLPFNSSFDVVFSFFTSFGYFADEEDNYQAAREMARAIKPGGRFFLDYLNPVNIQNRLRETTTRQADRFTIHERRWIDLTTRRINKRIEVRQLNRSIWEGFESVCLYSYEDLSGMLLNAGLRVRTCWGDYSGAVYGGDSPRMILTGIKVSP